MEQTTLSLSGKRVLLLGLGISGQSAAQYMLRRGADVTSVDSNQKRLENDAGIALLRNKGLVTQHESVKLDLKSFDLLVVSPGIPTTHPHYAEAKALGLRITGEVELACQEITQKCVAITGTNGKTTVTSLVAHVLNHAGMKAKALGNIGVPLTSAVDEKHEAEIFVIELSSFQLETLRGPFFDAGVILNITPDHLDRYESMREYALAKICLKDNIKVHGKLFVEDSCFKQYAADFAGSQIYSYGYRESCHLSTDTLNVYLSGKKVFSLPRKYQSKQSHDLENLMAAFALCSELGVSGDQFCQGLESFKKPPHRIEFVRSLAGVDYYDDSKGTNIDAVIRAVHSLEGDIVLVAGGIDKGSPYTPWISAFEGRVKAVCAIGQSAQKIKNDLEPYVPVGIYASLEDAVKHASTISQKGNVVLLSPGCSSFDMFTDYTHRGHEFQRVVHLL